MQDKIHAPKGFDLLVVDDEKDIRDVLSDLLSDEGYDVRTAHDGPSAIEAVSSRLPHLVLLDIWLGDTRFDGLKVLEELKKNHPHLPVVMMSGHGNIETAVESIKKGAYDYLEKPFKSERMLLLLKRALETAALRHENEQLKEDTAPVKKMVGSSPFMMQLRQTIDRIAPLKSRIFINAPPGSGKETIARLIHEQSPRAQTGRFLTLRCAALAPQLFEETLFGVEASATAEGIQKTGLFEKAHKGTLLLDEVSCIPRTLQGKLVKFLQDGTFCRIGGERPVAVDVRVLSSSSEDIKSLIAQERFREDLFLRLNVTPLSLKPLKAHREDIPELATYFLNAYAHSTGMAPKSFTQEALLILQSYTWPGNIQELKNVIDGILIRTIEDETPLLGAETLPPEITSGVPRSPTTSEGDTQDILKLPLRDAREAFERQYLLSQVSRFSGNISQTANFVGMERSALHRKLRALGVERARKTGT